MKTTLDLPDDLVREMKLQAVMQGRTLRDLAADFLRQGLGMAPGLSAQAAPDSPMVGMGANGLPVIRGDNNAPASHMGLEELLAHEQQALTSEDMQRAGLPH